MVLRRFLMLVTLSIPSLIFGTVLACSLTTGAATGITLYDLEAGTSDAIDIIGDAIVTCNDPGGYKLQVKSANGSDFVNDQLASAVNNYTIKIDEVLVDVSVADEFKTVYVSPTSPNHVDKHFVPKISIVGKGTGKVPDGTYSDTITYRLTPN